jgi:hypothetical protein
MYLIYDGEFELKNQEVKLLNFEIYRKLIHYE